MARNPFRFVDSPSGPGIVNPPGLMLFKCPLIPPLENPVDVPVPVLIP
jgi:hypothetical protein